MKISLKSALLLSLISNLSILAGGVTGVDDYDRFVTKNRLLQALYASLEGKYTKHEKEKLMEYFEALGGGYQSVPSFITGGDITTLESIKKLFKEIDDAPAAIAYQAEKFTSSCLDTLPNRGLMTRLMSLRTCFELSRAKARS